MTLETRCTVQCQVVEKQSLHCLPSDPNVRKEWINFIFNEDPDRISKNLVLCSLNFTADSFTFSRHNLTRDFQKDWKYDIKVPRERFESTQSRHYIYISGSRLLSVALAVLWYHTPIGLREQCRCIRWRHIRFKPARESKMTEAEDQTSSRILSAASRFWIPTAGKTWLKRYAK